MIKKNICILNSVEDAKYFLSEFRDVHYQWSLISTHGSVNDYLRTLNISCIELSSLITHDFILETFQKADPAVNTLLSDLDEYFSESISRILAIPKMNYFSPLYRYWGKFEYLSIFKSMRGLNSAFSDTCIVNVMSYQSVKTSFFAGDDVLTDVVQLLSQRYGFCLTIKHNELKNRRWLQKATRVIQNPTKTFYKIKNKKWWRRRKNNFSSPNRKNIILFEKLYDLEFLKSEIPKNINVILWPSSTGFPNGLPIDAAVDSVPIISQIEELISTIDISKFLSELDTPASFTLSLLVKNLLKDFVGRAHEYLLPLIILDRFYTKYHVDLGIWGNPPCMGFKTLLAEYLLKREIPVLGMQHGSTYGIENRFSRHFDSDFSRCTHYLTYGFDLDDLKETYPERDVPCEIIPVGSYKEYNKKVHQSLTKKSKRKGIDILFPITNSILIFLESLRPKPDVLTGYQLELLAGLELFKDLRVVAKPIRDYSDKMYSTVNILKSLKHIEVNDSITFSEALELYKVKCVVIEFPSTPLLEALGEDVEIFMLANPVPALRFTKTPGNLLRKRVHVFDKPSDLLKALKKWRNGNLPSLRNDEFYNEYLFNENTRHLIIKTIEGLT